MTTVQRIYLVAPKTAAGGDAKRLVRAPNAAQALRHVAKEFSVTLASQDALVAAVGEGVLVEEAGADPDKST